MTKKTQFNMHPSVHALPAISTYWLLQGLPSKSDICVRKRQNTYIHKEFCKSFVHEIINEVFLLHLGSVTDQEKDVSTAPQLVHLFRLKKRTLFFLINNQPIDK